MLDLHEGVQAIFEEAQCLGRGEFFDFRVLRRAVPCAVCGLIPKYHEVFGCRPALPAAPRVIKRIHEIKRTAYYTAHREAILAQKKAYYVANRETIVCKRKAKRERST